MNNTARKTESHQGYKNLDTFKFALIIDNTIEIYKEKNNLFKRLLYANKAHAKELIKDFLKSYKQYVKSIESDFYISNVDFNELTSDYYKDFIEYRNEILQYQKISYDTNKKPFIILVDILRRLDKINGNSYFVYDITFNSPDLNNPQIRIIPSNIIYGYNNQSNNDVKELIIEIFKTLDNVKIIYNDKGYKNTLRELKQFINLI